MFPNETPWPGLNYRTPDLMPGLRREFQKNDRLATHTALGELFIPDEFQKCKRVFMTSRNRAGWTRLRFDRLLAKSAYLVSDHGHFAIG
jgi:hypothetical protein